MADPIPPNDSDTTRPPATPVPAGGPDPGVNEADPDTGQDIVPPDDEDEADEPGRPATASHPDQSQPERREGVVSDPDVSLP
jgi:hypothetical protein